MFKIQKLFSTKAICLELKAKTKKEALQEIASYLAKHEFVKSAEDYEKALSKREKQISTGIGDGFAIPHAQHKTVLQDVVFVAKSPKGIDWDSPDGKKVKLIFAIALNAQQAANQPEVLAQLSKIMMDKNKIQEIQNSNSKEAILKTLTTFKVEKNNDTKNTGKTKKIVGITSCPTGIAHTYMAAQALKDAGDSLGYEVKIETQGRNVENKLSQAEIDAADIIILAADAGAQNKGRFAGKKVVETSTTNVIKNAKAVIQNFSTNAKVLKGVFNKEDETSDELSWSAFKNVYRNLMGGVSRMLPFVVAGGFFLGLAFLLDLGVTGGHLGVTRGVSRWFAGLGKTAFSIFVPILGAYVAFSIVGYEGLLPGFIAGFIAMGGGLLYGNATEGWENLWGGLTPDVNADILKTGSGFIGAMFGGYLAAATVVVARKYLFVKVPNTFRGIVSIIGVPLTTVLLTGLGMFMFQIPLSYFAWGLQKGIKELSNQKLLWLASLFMGIMMASDMGGPINKAAYVFATASLKNQDNESYILMQSVMIAGMIPPIAIALSTVIFRNEYSDKEKKAGMANWLMGMFFITEGAIPFAAKDPKRVIPSIIVASALGGLLTAALQIGISAPHGGVVVWGLLRSYLFTSTGTQIGLGIFFSLLIMAGASTVGALMLGFWKKAAIKSNKLVLDKN